MKNTSHHIRNIIPAALAAIIVVAALGVKIINPTKAQSALDLTSPSARLTNNRLSFVGGVTTAAAGSSNITIDTTTSASSSDINTDHLFPKDSVCFTPSTLIGCKDNKSYGVSSIKDTDEFITTSALTSTMTATDIIVATQAGNLTVTFTTVSQIPATGDMIITLPMADNAAGGNFFPDFGTTDTTSGFDIGDNTNGLVPADVSVSGCSWDTNEVITRGSATNDHTVQINATGACTAGTAITVTFANNKIINPGPNAVGSSQIGKAVALPIKIQTRSDTDIVLDEATVRVAPVQSVFVSATVDETLALTIAGKAPGTYCGVATTLTTTPTSVPWGTIGALYVGSEGTHNAAQQVTVSTNALHGYRIYIEENDQMGRNGDVCTGTAPGGDGYTFGSATCIADTTCKGLGCTESSAQNWVTDDSATSYGIGYSLQDVTGTNAVFNWDSTASPCTKTGNNAANFCAKQFADTQGLEDPFSDAAAIMLSASAVDNASAYVCYRIDILGTQPAGYYFNKVEYTAVPTF